MWLLFFDIGMTLLSAYIVFRLCSVLWVKAEVKEKFEEAATVEKQYGSAVEYEKRFADLEEKKKKVEQIFKK